MHKVIGTEFREMRRKGLQKLLSLKLLVQSRAWANEQVGSISPNMNPVQS